MRTKLLDYCLEIRRCRSLNKAARNLFISQPALSEALSSLEDELGFKLFNRSHKGMETTPEGARVLDDAERILATMNEWKSLAPEEILQAVPIADLNMFEGAWRYREEGGRIKIRNEWLSPRAILAGIAKSWIEQYADALRLMGCGRGEKAVVSGGMTRHSPFFAEVLSTLTGMTLFTNIPATQEDSFEGLLRLLENK